MASSHGNAVKKPRQKTKHMASSHGNATKQLDRLNGIVPT